MKRERAVPVLWLDIDGTVRKSVEQLGRFVNGPKDVEVFPDAVEQMRRYKASGYRIVGISNQGGIALGHVTMEDVGLAMLETQRQCGGLFDRIAFCSHHPSAPDPEMSVCWCRKPKIGLIVETGYVLAGLTNEYYPPHLGVLVGDMKDDEDCAANASLQFLHAVEWRRRAEIANRK